MLGLNEKHTTSANKDRGTRCRDLEREITKFVSADRARELASQIQKTTMTKTLTLGFINSLGTWIESDVLLGKTETKVYFTDIEMEYDYWQPLNDYKGIDWATVNNFLTTKGYKTKIEDPASNQSLGPIVLDYKVFTVSWN